jgi:hypothetical protein
MLCTGPTATLTGIPTTAPGPVHAIVLIGHSGVVAAACGKSLMLARACSLVRRSRMNQVDRPPEDSRGPLLDCLSARGRSAQTGWRGTRLRTCWRSPRGCGVCADACAPAARAKTSVLSTTPTEVSPRARGAGRERLATALDEQEHPSQVAPWRQLRPRLISLRISAAA